MSKHRMVFATLFPGSPQFEVWRLGVYVGVQVVIPGLYLHYQSEMRKHGSNYKTIGR